MLATEGRPQAQIPGFAIIANHRPAGIWAWVSEKHGEGDPLHTQVGNRRSSASILVALLAALTMAFSASPALAAGPDTEADGIPALIAQRAEMLAENPEWAKPAGTLGCQSTYFKAYRYSVETISLNCSGTYTNNLPADRFTAGGWSGIVYYGNTGANWAFCDGESWNLGDGYDIPKVVLYATKAPWC
ncbi:hypothetical protein ACQSSU_25665 [Micromonospora echinospora]